MLGQSTDALVDCNEGIRLDPDLAEAYQTRGMVQITLKKFVEGKKDFEKALELAEKEGNQELMLEIEQSLQKLDKNE